MGPSGDTTRKPRDHGMHADYVAFFAAVLPHAVRAARRITGDLAGAEDAASEALAKAYLRWDKLRLLPYREAWVLRVATNEALGATRKQARRERILRRQPPLAAVDDDLGDERRRMVEAIRQLPKRQREVVTLRYYADLSTDEAAAALDISPGAVKSHLHRGLHTLAERLGTDISQGTHISEGTLQ